MYQGYLEVGGVPIINAEATEAYVANLAPNIPLRPRFNTDMLHLANEEPRYRSPVLDEQSWVNALDRATQEFYGLYPLAIEGIDDSTLTTEVVEHLNAGGSALAGREGSRAIRVSGLLVAASKLGAQAGLTWLRSVVRGDGCATCDAGQMRYFLAEPDVCERAFGDVIDSNRRSFGSVPEGTVRYAFSQGIDQVDPLMPADVTWLGSFTEGTSIIWGASEPTSTVPIEIHGPVAPLRRNYVPNPTFRTSAAKWLLTGTSTLTGTYHPSGGSGDNGGYYTVAPLVAGGNAVTSSTFGQGTFGSGYFGGLSSTSTLSTTSVDNVPAGSIAVTLDLRSALGATVGVTIREATTGLTIGGATILPTENWGRYLVLGSHASSNAPLTIELSTTDSFDLDNVVMEVGSQDLGYFDGNSGNGVEVTQWAGVPDESTSVQIITGGFSVQRDDSNFRPFISIVGGSAQALDLVWLIREQLEMGTQLLPYERFLYEVACTQGPQVVTERDFGNHGYFIQVDFTFVAGNPYSYGSQVPIPIGAVTSAAFTDPDPQVPDDDAWLIDPDCLAPSAPPSAPVVLGNCIDVISTWQRYYVPIPAEQVADWASSVPVITINSLGDPVKQVRVRFHPNPFNYAVTRVDPLAYCSEFVLSYLPGSASLTVDGIGKQVTASKAGKATVSANHLLYGSNGGPVTWPELSCAVPYVMTLDVPSPADRDLFDIELTLAKKE